MPQLQPVPDLWKAEGLHQEIRSLPDLLSKYGFQGRNPRCGKGQLVKLVEIGYEELYG
jgi:hypothetical protein